MLTSKYINFCKSLCEFSLYAIPVHDEFWIEDFWNKAGLLQTVNHEDSPKLYLDSIPLFANTVGHFRIGSIFLLWLDSMVSIE